jgi:hypothetical protein
MVWLGSAALALVFAAIGGALLIGRNGVGLGGPPPTIMATEGPVKVQPANPGGVVIPNQAISALDKGGSDGVAGSKVVSKEEQPIDLIQAVKTAAARHGEAGAAAQSPLVAAGFPKPKRVKTVSVRPDGTIIPNSPQAAPAAPAETAPTRSIPAFPLNPAAETPPARVASLAPVAPPERPAPTPKPPVAPKTTARVASVAPHAVEAQPESPPPAAPQKPVQDLQSGGGGFAVQLASTGSEGDARTAIGRLAKRYVKELGALHPTVVRAHIGDRSVYRVRVVGLGHGDAANLCSSIKSSGGDCFVARN